LGVPKIGTIVEQGNKTMQQDDELKLVESCVMVTRDELQSVPNAGSNLRTSKVHMLLPLSFLWSTLSSNMFIPFSYV